MQIRLTQQFAFNQVRDGMQSQITQMAKAQEQIASGKRLQRPSDDPGAAARVLSLEGQLSGVRTHVDSIDATRPMVESAASALQQTTGLMAEARAVMVAAMNGTLSDSDRATIAGQLDGIRASLLAVANTRINDQYIFGGTESLGEPFVEVTEGGVQHVVYQGGGEGNSVSIGNGQSIEIAIEGDEVFGRTQPTGVQLAGLTGAVAGVGPNDGQGYGSLDIRHDGTSGALGSGLTFASAGASDTMLGDKLVTVDSVAGTVKLGAGPTRSVPGPGSPDVADFRIVDADGSELHLDFSAFTGVDFSGTVIGAGSISFDGAPYQSLDFADDNLELVDGDGRILHVDTRAISRSGEELATFGGTLNMFDVLAGAADDMRAGSNFDTETLTERLSNRFQDLQVAEDDIFRNLARIGARSERLNAAHDRIEEVIVHLESIVSDLSDTDVIEAVTRLTQAEQALQVAQAAGSRMLQQSLLNFL
ncbi:MAG: flagellar hook-associated protein 3 FlgL [Chlamydiales bacterium]|jgi:flagellar hook-associated protein 3 FlgL